MRRSTPLVSMKLRPRSRSSRSLGPVCLGVLEVRPECRLASSPSQFGPSTNGGGTDAGQKMAREVAGTETVALGPRGVAESRLVTVGPLRRPRSTSVPTDPDLMAGRAEVMVRVPGTTARIDPVSGAGVGRAVVEIKARQQPRVSGTQPPVAKTNETIDPKRRHRAAKTAAKVTTVPVEEHQWTR